MHGTYGQEFRFGGHDFFAQPQTFPSEPDAKRQEMVSPQDSKPFMSGKWKFLSLVVKSQTAYFYEDGDLIESQTLSTSAGVGGASVVHMHVAVRAQPS